MQHPSSRYIQVVPNARYVWNPDQTDCAFWLGLLSGSADHPLSPTDGTSFVGVATIKGCATTAVSSVADLEGPDACERLT